MIKNISMLPFGINTVVGTSQAKIDMYFNKFATEPDHLIGAGAGKNLFLQQLKQELIQLDKFFEKSLKNGVLHKQRWIDFMEDCVILAVLDSYMNKTKIQMFNMPAPLPSVLNVYKI
jgi:hypothetical protein